MLNLSFLRECKVWNLDKIVLCLFKFKTNLDKCVVYLFKFKTNLDKCVFSSLSYYQWQGVIQSRLIFELYFGSCKFFFEYTIFRPAA